MLPQRKSVFSVVVASLFYLATLEVPVHCRQVVKVRGRPRKFSAIPSSNFDIEPKQVAVSADECPQKEGTQVYSDPADCGRFFKCTNGTLSHENCANGLLFDLDKAFTAVHDFCTYNWAVDCGERRSYDEPVENPGCPYQFGIFPIPGESCTSSYVKCAFGKATTVSCDLGLVFDPKIRGCNWPDLLIEEQGCNPSEQLGGFRCPTSIDELESEISRRFFPFPRFSIKGRPELYVICVDNRPRLQSCGEGLFDKSSLTCVYDRL